jgi:excisionase family DNA binding protein
MSRLRSLLGKEVSRVEDKHRKQFTVAEAAEYLGLTPGKVQDMVERGVVEADKFAGTIHIPRQEVERIERESAP